MDSSKQQDQKPKQTYQQQLSNGAHQASQMYAKRSHVHSYVGEGMEEGEFAEATENVRDLYKELVECGQDRE